MKTEIINNLDCLVFRRKSPKILILLHGYGADKFDLAPLSETLGPYDYCFPNGLLFSGMGGAVRGWFTLNPILFEQALITGNFDLLDTPQSRKELIKSEEALKGLLDHFESHYEQVYVGGFSQGGALAVSMALNQDSRVNKLIALSGFLIRNQEANYKKGLQTFQSHGLADGTLPYSEGERLKSFLTSLNPEHEFHSFNGGHEIPPVVLDKLRDFLGR